MSVTTSIPPPTSEQIAIVKSTVPVLEQYGVNITTTFYKNIHKDVPALHEVFNQTNQKTGHQARALAMSVLAYAKYIDNLSVLSDTVELICQKHASLLIQAPHYDLVGEYLLAAIKEVLGAAATDDIILAWEAAYWQLARIMINREQEIYAEKTVSSWREFIVDERIKESEEVTSFYLKPKDGKPVEQYKPGQYISVRVAVPQQEWKQVRQYSLSTNPDSQRYRISVKKDSGIDLQDESMSAHPGWVSNVLHDEIKIGDSVDLTFPCGSFYLEAERAPDAPIVLLSAGVGLTPLMAMLDTLVDQDSKRPVTWIHGTRGKNSHAFGDHVKAIMKTKENWHAIVYNTNNDIVGDDTNYKVIGGRINLDNLHEANDLHLDNADTQYFICGPDAFMVDTKDKLVSLGASSDNVKYERFGTGDVIVEKKAVSPADASGCPFSRKMGAGNTTLRCPVTGAIDESLKDSDEEDM